MLRRQDYDQVAMHGRERTSEHDQGPIWLTSDLFYCLLDLGTGTGCLLLALLSELPNALGFGLDLVPVGQPEAVC